jgi:hypothetical protein
LSPAGQLVSAILKPVEPAVEPAVDSAAVEIVGSLTVKSVPWLLPVIVHVAEISWPLNVATPPLLAGAACATQRASSLPK